MRRLPVLLLLCLLAGIAGGSLLLSGGDPEAPPMAHADEPGAAADDPTAPAVATGEPATADPDAAEDTDAAPVPDDDDPHRTAAVPVAETRDGPTVHVVRGPNQQPVADAEVFFLLRPEGEQRAQKQRLGQSMWPETWGQRTRSDAMGAATLPAAKAPWLVAARAGDEFAFAMVPPGRRSATLLMQIDEQVVIATRRTDERPQPAIPVLLFQGLGTDEARQIWDGETGADGSVTVPHFQLVRQQLQDPNAAEPKPERFAAVAAVASAPPALAEFAGRPATKAPVVLYLPPLGGIDLQLTDHRGTPLLSPATIGATTEPVAPILEPLRIPGAPQHQRAAKPVGEAAVRLPLFGIGQPLRLFARFEGDRRGTTAVVPGPDSDGAVARRTLALQPHHVLLAGRLRLASGAPFGKVQLPASLWRGDRDVWRPTLHTIDDGRFDLVLTARTEPDPFTLEIRCTMPATADRQMHELGARIALPRLDGGQRIELGDVVLDELPLLCAGIVVDDRGEPVPAADVRVQQEQPPDGNRNREPWRDLPHLATRTGEDGSFVFAGRLPPGALRVRADTDLHFADSVPLRAAGQQLRVCIQRCGILRGRVLLPDWLPDGTAALTLQPFDEALRARETRRIDLTRRGGGRFRVEPLRPGRFDALVTLRNLPEPLVVVADVFVTPGEVRDGRLAELDLRQALFRYRLRAVDARGIPVAVDGPILMRTQTPQGEKADAAFRWRGGRAEVITQNALAEFQFFGRGIQPTRLVLAPGDHDVYLQVLRPALLQIPGARALCGPTRRVRVSVILTEATGLPESLQGMDQRSGEQFSFARWDLGKSSGAWLGTSDSVEVPLMKSGKYEVVLRAHATGSERSLQASLSLGTFALVADSPQPETVTVPLDAQALVQMLANLDAQHQQQQQQQQRPGPPNRPR